MAKICAICDSPTARSLHFGAMACKACAAFFRRAVALNVIYKCKSNCPPCAIHHEKRIICKRCRFEKCISLGMRRELVQSKGKVEERIERAVEYPVACSSSSTSASSSFSGSIDGGTPNCLEDPLTIIQAYTKIESRLNDRRKLLHTRSMMRDIFAATSECPFTFDDLVFFDYRTYKGYDRYEYLLLLDYMRDFPEFESLGKQDQNIFFRFGCAVDAMMNAAYYTIKIGMEKKILVQSDATYVPMDPLPMSGNEPDAISQFETNEDFMRYKSLIPPLIDNWFTMVIPMQRLDPTFAEFALLKALVCWHICYYKFLPEDRELCDRQRNLITRALFALARDGNGGETRVGELILFISSAFENIYDLVTGLHMINFFGIMECDPMLKDLLDHTTY